MNKAFLGTVEPHEHMLSIPQDGQLLYKIMTTDNLLQSIFGNYLHFNRVDSYGNFPGADINDGKQLPEDQPVNESVRFKYAPNFSAADYYDQSRNRTYVCCFSLRNSEYIWKNYANDSTKGKVCIVFNFGKLRSTLNETLRSQDAAIVYNGNRCYQLFSINYGKVEYIERETHRASLDRLPNPISYTYFKDKRFLEEEELRISLHTLAGIEHFTLKNGSKIKFLPSLQMSFNFRNAFANKTIQEIVYSPDCDLAFLSAEL